MEDYYELHNNAVIDYADTCFGPYCVYLDRSTNDYVTIPDISSDPTNGIDWDMFNGQFTAGARFYLNSQASYPVGNTYWQVISLPNILSLQIMCKYDGSNPPGWIAHCSLYDGVSWRTSYVDQIADPTDAWHYIALKRGFVDGNGNVTINSVYDNTLGFSVSFPNANQNSPSGPMYIGCESVGTDHFNGRIEEPHFIIWPLNIPPASTNKAVRTGKTWCLIEFDDVDAPSIPDNLLASAVNNTDDEINVTWDAATDDVLNAGNLTYILRRNNNVIYTGPNTSFTDTNLTAYTTYTYTIEAQDHAGNLSGQSSPVLENTFDITPPSVPTGLSATAVSDSRVDLSWNQSTDPTPGRGLGGYKVYRDGVEIADVATESYIDNGVSGSTSYNYTVAAYDWHGTPAQRNLSSQCSQVGVTTPSSVGWHAINGTNNWSIIDSRDQWSGSVFTSGVFGAYPKLFLVCLEAINGWNSNVYPTQASISYTVNLDEPGPYMFIYIISTGQSPVLINNDNYVFSGADGSRTVEINLDGLHEIDEVRFEEHSTDSSGNFQIDDISFYY